MKHERSTSTSGSADGLDVLLGSFRAPTSLSRRTDAEWDDSAAATVQKALSGDAGDPKFIESLLAPPSLGREAGEPSSVVVGESKMSSDRDSKSSSGPSSSGVPSVRPRPSLKELAERVSKTPPPPSVQPGPRASVPELPVATLKAGTSGAPVATATSSATEAPRSTATPLPISSPSAPVQIVEASAAANDASSPTSKMPPTLPTGVTPIHAAKGGKSGGMLVGLGVAALGLAAAAAMFFYVKGHKAVDAPKQAVQQEQVEPTSTAKAGDKAEPPTPEVAKVDKPGDGALDINQLGNVSAQPTVAGGGPLPPSSATTAVAANGPKGPVKVNPDGTLDDAMKKAAGPEDGKPDVPSPASEGNTPKNLPDAPPQGSVTAALGAAKGAAKGCVAGADDVSTAMVTFGSSGAVQSVSVGGWAAGKPAASCIQSALKGANVGPFSKPTFGPVPVTIRP